MKSESPCFDLAVISPDIIIGPMMHPISSPKSINETNNFAISSFIDGTHQQVEGVTFPFYHFVSSTVTLDLWLTPDLIIITGRRPRRGSKPC